MTALKAILASKFEYKREALRFSVSALIVIHFLYNIMSYNQPEHASSLKCQIQTFS